MSKRLLCLTCRGLLTSVLIAPAAGWAQSPDVLQPLSEAELAGEQGRAGMQMVQLSGANQSAVLSGNSAIGVTSGDNWVGDGAFANANGFTTVIQNSGNNVIIQDSLIVNVSVDY